MSWVLHPSSTCATSASSPKEKICLLTVIGFLSTNFCVASGLLPAEGGGGRLQFLYCAAEIHKHSSMRVIIPDPGMLWESHRWTLRSRQLFSLKASLNSLTESEVQGSRFEIQNKVESNICWLSSVAQLSACFLLQEPQKRKRKKKRGAGKRSGVRNVRRWQWREDERNKGTAGERERGRTPDATGERCWASYHLRWEHFTSFFSSAEAPSRRAPWHLRGGKLHCTFCTSGLWVRKGNRLRVVTGTQRTPGFTLFTSFYLGDRDSARTYHGSICLLSEALSLTLKVTFIQWV